MSKRSKAWEGKQKEVWANRESGHSRVVGADHGIYNVDNNSIKIASLTYANEQLKALVDTLRGERNEAIESEGVLIRRLRAVQKELAMATDEIVTLKEQRDAAVRRAQEMEKQLYDMIGTEEW